VSITHLKNVATAPEHCETEHLTSFLPCWGNSRPCGQVGTVRFDCRI